MLFGTDVLGTGDRIAPVWPQAVPESRLAFFLSKLGAGKSRDRLVVSNTTALY